MKLTRRSYNRRIYTFGILAFLAVTLISTGFAAWVMSTNTSTEETGSAHVGVITDGQLSFVDNHEGKKVTFNGDNKFRFDADASDNQGEIKAQAGTGATYENLSVEFSVTLTPETYVSGLRVKLELPDSFFAAAESGYIVLPDCAVKESQSSQSTGVFIEAASETTLVQDEVSKITEGVNITFTYTMNFTWGEKFGNKNPGFYLDEAVVEGTDTPKYDYNAKKNILVDFKKTIYGSLVEGKTDAEILSYSGPDAGVQYKLNLTAEAK